MAVLSLQQKYDILIHTVEESGLSIDEQEAIIVDIFPAHIVGDTSNDKHVDEYVIEKYAEARGLGLSIADSAHSAEVTEKIMLKASQGEGLSRDMFVMLAKAELYATAIKKRKHLANISDAGDGSYKASVAFLEKLYPDVYGQRVQVDDPAMEKVAHSNMEIARRLSFILSEAIRAKGSGKYQHLTDTVRQLPRADGG